MNPTHRLFVRGVWHFVNERMQDAIMITIPNTRPAQPRISFRFRGGKCPHLSRGEQTPSVKRLIFDLWQKVRENILNVRQKTFKIFEKKFKKRLAWSAPAWCLIKIKFFNKNCSIFCHEPEKTWQNIINEDQRTAGWQNWLLNQHQTSFSKSRSGEESYIFYPLQKPRLC